MHAPRYELIEEKEVDLEVQECISAIRISKNSQEVFDCIRRLRIKTERGERIAHQPNVLSAFESALQRPMAVSNQKISQEFMLTLRKILQQERKDKIQKSDAIIEKISDRILDKVIHVTKRKSKFPDKYTIEFLAECCKEDACMQTGSGL